MSELHASVDRWTRGDPIVVFGDDWGRYPSTVQHLFRHIASDYPIVWVNSFGHRPPSLNLTDARRAVQKVKAMIRQPVPKAVHGLAGGGIPRAVIEPRGVLPWHGFAPVHALNSTLLVRAITGRLASLGLTRPPVLVTGTPASAGVVGRLGEAAAIYFCMDDFLNFPGVSAKMIAPLEQRLRQRVDALVATAHSLTISKLPASGIAHHLPQGVNYEHFATPQPEPEAMRGIPHPRIGYSGTVGGYCDLQLVRRVAEAYPQCSVVLVGNVTADGATMDAVRLPNVHVLGLRPYSELPGFVQSFDIAIIPYLRNATTLAVDPLKLLEYLAAGLPVVTTAIPEMAKYSEVVTVAPDDDAFVSAIADALDQDRAVARTRGQAVARQNTWKVRSEELLRIIHEVVARRATDR